VLGQLGDPRFGGPLLLPCRFRGQPEPLPGPLAGPLPGLVEVPAGPFVMGSPKYDRESYDDEHGNPPTLTMPHRYWINRYPVTVGQFAAFIEAGGYRERRWWTQIGWDWLQQDPRNAPAGWMEQHPYSSRPVVMVTWYEAMAYAAWVDAAVRGQEGAPLPAGYVLRLPTEAEWECAARGAAGRRYVWGDDWDPARANLQRTIGSPSPVGAFPGGATPGGIMDLTGNCWEWCLSALGDYPYGPDQKRNNPEVNTRRVLRGGAWGHGRRGARAASRGWFDPGDFSKDVGFRLVLSLADSDF
jgi:formylglycine-generating enzyme required for sulfatase activity